MAFYSALLGASLGKISISLNSLTAALPNIDALYKQVIQAEDYSRVHPEARRADIMKMR